MKSFALDRLLLILAVVSSCCFGATRTLATEPLEKSPAEAVAPLDAETLEFVTTKVQPLLQARCYECHGPEAEEPGGDLQLFSRQAMLQGGGTGPAIKPGNPHESLLIKSIRYEGDYEMPPESKMPEGEVAILSRWIKMGAPWPEDGQATPKIIKKKPFPLQERRDEHWSWQAIQHQVPPTVKNEDLVRAPLDHFIVSALEAKGLAPAKQASRRALIRRATFDLIGLPSAKAEVDAFLNDPASTDQAFAKVVDRLLASPHFGERWGRHWLDLVRYAETLGHEFDYPIEHAYRYRDYVIRALNADVPYDQFVMEHMAGDILKNPRRHPTEDYNESVIGTGFWYFGEGQHAPVDSRNEEMTQMDNQIDVATKTFMGLTVACARCHDHKFDAITTKDYYSLAGFVKSSRRQEALLDPHGTIHRKAEQIRHFRRVGDQILASIVADAARRAKVDPLTENVGVAPWLLVARGEGLKGPNPGQVGRWQKALRDDALSDPSHPLYVWKQLALAELSEADFIERRKTLAKQQAEVVKKAAELEAKSPLFADFENGNLDGWFRTGEAFDDRPSRSGDWNARQDGLTAKEPNVVHSGNSGNKLRGVLRSPTFTLNHKSILYRLAGKQGQIRLIIDGYTFDIHSPLLFKGAAFDVETGGQWKWVRQAQDLVRFPGSRAHIEIIDHGEGFTAVDEIRFSNGDQPPPELNPHAAELLIPAVDSVEKLAEAYEKQWSEAAASWKKGTATKAQNKFVNWMLKYDLGGNRLALLRRQLHAYRKLIRREADLIPAPMRVLAMAEGTPEDEYVLIRGNHKTPGDKVPRQMLEAIGGNEQSPVMNSGRFDLAMRMVDRSNPFTSRVMVNRIWHHLFGRGIVASVDNFGVLGQAPTHPELLDYLSEEFMNDGWSQKRLIRKIMLSSTYQMSSKPHDPRADEVDPTNALLHRQRLRRLQGEAIRDSILAISGELDRSMYGKSVPVHLTPFMSGRGRPRSGPLDGKGRRSLYIEVRRNFLTPMMLAFDMPIPFGTVGRRNVSNVPAQPLIMMNDPLVLAQTKKWARRSLANKTLTPRQRITALYESSLARLPSDDEVAAAIAFMNLQANSLDLPRDAWKTDERVWADLCHVLWNVKEFIFIQ